MSSRYPERLVRGDRRHVALHSQHGITEGFHTKMEVLQRQAYGFRNFNNYRLRLRLCGVEPKGLTGRAAGI